MGQRHPSGHLCTHDAGHPALICDCTLGAGQRVMQAANMVLEAVEWVQKTHPKIWQRRGGRDHIYLIPNDEGAELAAHRHLALIFHASAIRLLDAA